MSSKVKVLCGCGHVLYHEAFPLYPLEQSGPERI